GTVIRLTPTYFYQFADGDAAATETVGEYKPFNGVTTDKAALLPVKKSDTVAFKKGAAGGKNRIFKFVA
ncbi:MAG: hypothetical protein NC099_02880, partial [Corallococcus sp.]|nr:hypothetical protein [Corallococcus sp.]